MERVFKLSLLLFLIFFTSCGQNRRPINVMIIGVDTLRPDHLGCYGYERSTSLNIDRLASEGTLFENVIAPSPWTLPSFASVFTSLYPSQHGANHFRTPMGTTFPTLAALLKAEGYATAAIANATYLKRRYALDRGFDFYDMPPPTGRVADGTTSDALRWIDETGHQPFLIFVHYFDPHIPYSPPSPYDTIFDPDYRGPITNPYDPKRLSSYRMDKFEEMRSLTPADWNRIQSLYDGEIAFTDEAIGELLEGLKDRDLTENTLIVFLSDHGEEFFEHQGFEHGHTLFGELLRVPLILSLPGKIPQNLRITEQVRLVDVAPTILDLLGMDWKRGFEGVSLIPLLDNNGRVLADEGSLLSPELAYSEAILYGPEKKSLTEYPWKIIYNMITGEKSCFNLSEDPGELKDIAEHPDQTLRRVEDRLYRILFRVSPTWYVEVAPGGHEHTFDLRITTKRTRGAGRFSLHKVFDSRGELIDTQDLEEATVLTPSISIENLKATTSMTLAFILRWTDSKIQFDFRIDGKPATNRTFVGQSLVAPLKMPFILQDSEDKPANRGEPIYKPEPPYFLVWLSRTDYDGDRAIELDEETKRELRSLGYIQ